MNLAENLKKIRKEHNLSQEQLAEKLGVSRQSVSKWESNQAYPEMDKMVQLCKMFELNIDDLLNNDITQIAKDKQTKNNINKTIQDFLDCITKITNMFGSMNFKTKIKCIFEQCIIIGILILCFIAIGLITKTILNNIFSFVPSDIYIPILHAFEGIYLIACIICGIILVFYIFKIRYLNYCVIIKDEIYNEETTNIEEKDYKKEKQIINKLQKKIIIRDPEHTGYKFINVLLKFLLFIIKLIVIFVGILFCLCLIIFVISIIVSFVFIQTGTLFIGILISLLSFAALNLILLIIIYDFISSHKSQKKLLAISFVTSLITLGIGLGIILIDIPNFKIIDKLDNKNVITKEETIQMNSKILFDNNSNIQYIESNNKDIRVVYQYLENHEISFKKYDNIYYLIDYKSVNIMDEINQFIKNIKYKEIYDYSINKVYIYTTKENINILTENADKYYYAQQEKERQQQEVINTYELRIEELTSQLNEANDKYYIDCNYQQ